MGLAERRAIKNFQENHYPKFKKEMDDIAGFELNVDVKWDTLAVEDYANLYEEAFEKVYFKPLIEALKAICIDDLGKDALKQGLKKIVINYTGGSTDISFQNGVLNFDHYPVSNLDYWGERKQEVQRVLEKGL